MKNSIFLKKMEILYFEVISLFFLPRTDLALEDAKNDSKELIEFEKNGIKIQKIVVDSETSKRYKKKEGIYYSLTTDAMVDLAHDECSNVSEVVKEILEDIYLEFGLNMSSYILVVGLGNDEVTPDSLGPKVIKKLLVTKHFFDLDQLDENLGVVGALSPGVMGQTGIETSDIIKALVKKTKPDLVLVVDALASRSLYRINRTIQISTAGINPGSGVGNKRKEISMKTLGVPVVAIGVPTVVDVISIFNDTLDFVASTKEEAKLEYNEYDVKEALSESNLDFMVTPKEIDEVMNMLSDVISKGINTSIHNLNAYE